MLLTAPSGAMYQKVLINAYLLELSDLCSKGCFLFESLVSIQLLAVPHPRPEEDFCSFANTFIARRDIVQLYSVI